MPRPAAKRIARRAALNNSPRKKPVPKKAPRRRIDFAKIKWGTFTARFLAWKKRHPRAKVNTLREFAAYILAHPEKFTLHARRKALFYRNIILKGKVAMPIKKYAKQPARRPKSRTTKTKRAA
jgi:hypothetical protein